MDGIEASLSVRWPSPASLVAGRRDRPGGHPAASLDFGSDDPEFWDRYALAGDVACFSSR